MPPAQSFEMERETALRNRCYPPGKIFRIPSRWIITEKFWSRGDMTIKDQWGNKVFKAVGGLCARRKLSFVDLRTGQNVANIKERFLSWNIRYDIFVDGSHFGSVKENDGCCGTNYCIKSILDTITVIGDCADSSFEFCRGNKVIAEMHKRPLTFTDTYAVGIRPEEDVVFILACCVAIDKCVDKKEERRKRQQNSATGFNDSSRS
ncbi:LURP-one-related domain-containing protein [Ditylenchus destructor]|uniref:LURP-one-related domain-containing protein n=1 Tax=Ditylenchus destructor TaxID=166010 RepID=A0AAD4MK74_9BILA|nr:LURP-one-related domain-containing protein [Ditylenchus destructor]